MRSRLLLPAVAIVALALCLRIAVSGVGVVLDPLRADLGMSAGLAGLLTTLPVVAFGVVGLLTGALVRRFGIDHLAAVALLVLAVATATRVLVPSSVPFLLLTAVALAAAAVGNVILPPLARRHAPDHVRLLSSVYGAALLTGAAATAALTVPIADVTGSWRPALGWWAVVPALAVVPWVLVLRRPRADGHAATDAPAGPRPRLLRSRTTWVMAVFFGIQSTYAYVQFGWFATVLIEDGVDDHVAASLMALLAAAGIPIALLMPTLSRLVGDVGLSWVWASATVLGWGGLWLTEAAVPWVWAVLLGVGSGAFPWVLSMIPRRSRSLSGTAALSATTQGIGYGIAALGPFGVGVVHEVTGSFDVALVVLAASGVLLGVLGTIISRAGFVEDEI